MPSPIHSEEDSVFTDADEEPGRPPVGAAGSRGRRRVSVSERVHGFEKPPASPSVSQKRRRVSSHGQRSPAGLDDLALSQIKGLIEAGNAIVIGKLERLEGKLESLEKRLDILEHDAFQTASRTGVTENKITKLEQENQSLREQIESMDTNSRQD